MIAKKIIFSTLLISIGGIVSSYADDIDSSANISKDSVAYNNLTNSFVPSDPDNQNTVSSTTDPWEAMIGVGVGVGPKYPGSDATSVQAMPAFNVAYDNRYFLNSTRGLGINVINKGPLTLGASVFYSYGNKRSSEFSGLNNAKDAAMTSIFANYTLSLWNFGLAAYKTIGELGGAGFYQASVTRAVPITKQLAINLIANAQYDDGSYMQSLYGVTSAEAITSGLSTYTVHRGWDNVSYGISPVYSVNKHWSVIGNVSAIRYVDQVAKSPVIQDKQNYIVGAGVIYNF